MNYIKINREDVCNGNGLRVVLWLSGCNHHCEGCQNPQTWDANAGTLFDDAAKQIIFEELDKLYVSGITFSGGDPLYESNLDGVLKLITEIRHRYGNKKNIWIYTGYTWESIFGNHPSGDELLRQKVVRNCDVLVDGPYLEKLRDITLAFRGSRNQRLIDVKKSLESGGVILWEQ